MFYDSSNSPFLFSGPVDASLPALERVVAIEMGYESLAIPFSVLETEPVVHFTLGGQDLVVFFEKETASAVDDSLTTNGRDVGAVGVFNPHLKGQKLFFQMQDSEIVDMETGSIRGTEKPAESGLDRCLRYRSCDDRLDLMGVVCRWRT